MRRRQTLLGIELAEAGLSSADARTVSDALFIVYLACVKPSEESQARRAPKPKKLGVSLN